MNSNFLGLRGGTFGSPPGRGSAQGSSPPRARASVGKSGRGLFSVIGKRIFIVRNEDIGSAFCGGEIGKEGMSTSMCIKTCVECNVAKHRVSKAALVIDKLSESGGYVCIKVDANKVFTNLVIPVESLGPERLELYLAEFRTYDQWEMMFRGVLASGAEEDDGSLFLEFEQSIAKRGLVETDGLESASPLKKSRNQSEDSELQAARVIDFNRR